MRQPKFIFNKAFTLVEMLAVIAIIAVLAALITGAAGRAGGARQKARVRAEMENLTSVIESYKNDQGFYPPGGTKPELAPLFYELSGTKRNNDGSYSTLDGSGQISADAITNIFGLSGFANSNPETAKRYFSSLKPGQYAAIKNNYSADVQTLIVPVDAPALPEVLSKDGSKKLNTWRYVANKPTNNPAAFDLWADVVIRGETVTIGNWKE